MKELIPLVVALTLIAAIAGLCLALVFSVTEEPMRQADLQKMRDSITAVLPEYSNSPDEDANWVESGEYRFFIARDEADSPVGLAFIAIAKEGYGGSLETMVGITTEAEIIRIKNLKHMETPGLGSKIKDDFFKEQFFGASFDNRTLFVRKDDKGTAEKPPIDAITGATISSRAVADSVRLGLQYFVDNRDDILSAKPVVEETEGEADEGGEQ